MQYKKSDKCLICGKEIFNDKRDGCFLCFKCCRSIEDELMELLQESEYKDKIKLINLTTCSSFGSSNKTTTIKVSAGFRNVYVQIPTNKLLQIRDLGDKELLFQYLETEIKCQYAIQVEEMKEEMENEHFK